MFKQMVAEARKRVAGVSRAGTRVDNVAELYKTITTQTDATSCLLASPDTGQAETNELTSDIGV